MHIHVNGRNVEITDAIKAYVKEKAGKVVAHYDQIQAIDVVLTVIKNPSVADSHVAEINCKVLGDTVRVEDNRPCLRQIGSSSEKVQRKALKGKRRLTFNQN